MLEYVLISTNLVGCIASHKHLNINRGSLEATLKVFSERMMLLFSVSGWGSSSKAWIERLWFHAWIVSVYPFFCAFCLTLPSTHIYAIVF